MFPRWKFPTFFRLAAARLSQHALAHAPFTYSPSRCGTGPKGQWQWILNRYLYDHTFFSMHLLVWTDSRLWVPANTAFADCALPSLISRSANFRCLEVLLQVLWAATKRPIKLSVRLSNLGAAYASCWTVVLRFPIMSANHLLCGTFGPNPLNIPPTYLPSGHRGFLPAFKSLRLFSLFVKFELSLKFFAENIDPREPFFRRWYGIFDPHLFWGTVKIDPKVGEVIVSFDVKNYQSPFSWQCISFLLISVLLQYHRRGHNALSWCLTSWVMHRTRLPRGLNILNEQFVLPYPLHVGKYPTVWQVHPTSHSRPGCARFGCM